MAIRFINIKQKNCICNLCGRKWIPKKENPKECPRCKRLDWNRAKK